MDHRRVNHDFRILDDYRRQLLTAGQPTRSRHTWRLLGDSGFELFLYDFPLPPNAQPRTTHVKIEGRSCLYDPAGDGLYHFYRNVWLGDAVQVRIPGQRGWGKLPRLHDRDEQGWYYICVHPGTVRGNENILSLLRVLELYVRNAEIRMIEGGGPDPHHDLAWSGLWLGPIAIDQTLGSTRLTDKERLHVVISS